MAPRAAALARAASAAASAHAPLAWSSWARCTRHCPRNGTRSGWAVHQVVRASVHSDARRRSNAAIQASIAAEYTTPAGSGERSPLEMASIASSSRCRPRRMSPRAISASPMHMSPHARSSRSPVRRPTSTISTPSDRAVSRSSRSSAWRLAAIRPKHRPRPSVGACARQVLGPGEPTAGVGNLAAEEQDDAQPHRAPRRVFGTASRLMHGVRPLPRLLARLLLTDQVRRNGEPLADHRARGRPRRGRPVRRTRHPTPDERRPPGPAPLQPSPSVSSTARPSRTTHAYPRSVLHGSASRDRSTATSVEKRAGDAAGSVALGSETTLWEMTRIASR